ncbi:hypothetical protein ACF0H5_000183 [Mactra antiquata]
MTSYCQTVNGASCQDIDHTACLSMAKQNSNMCSDPTLAMNVCPQSCGQCPLLCYSCHATANNVSQCNTITCAHGEQCMIKKKDITVNEVAYSMLCGPSVICSDFRRSVEKSRKYERSLFLACCDTDLCNVPYIFDATTTTTTSTTTTISTTTTTTTQTSTVPTNAAALFPNCIKDVVVMMEDSLAMDVFFPVLKYSLKSFVSKLDIGPTKTRVALGIFYNTHASSLWDLNTYKSKGDLLNAVDRLYPRHSGARIAFNKIAVFHAVQYFKRDDRQNVPNVLIIISQTAINMKVLDFNHYIYNSYADVERTMRHRYPDVITIANGGSNTNEMRSIATDGNHYFYLPEPTIGVAAVQEEQTQNQIVSMICR